MKWMRGGAELSIVHGLDNLRVVVDAQVDPGLRQCLPVQLRGDPLQPVVVRRIVGKCVPKLAESRLVVAQKVVHKVAPCRRVRVPERNGMGV